MRYIKFKDSWPNMEALKQQHTALISQEQHNHRKALWLHRLGTAVFVLLSLGSFVGSMLLVHSLLPAEKDIFSTIVYLIGILAFGILALILCPILGAVVAAPLWSKYKKVEKHLKLEALHKACSHLRTFYQFQEPYLVTKCFVSSDRKFNRHDVCLFVVDNELRITANLHYGFFHPDKDLGCYVFSPEEIRVHDAQFKNTPAAELQVDGISFLLGRKAKTFIENSF